MYSICSEEVLTKSLSFTPTVQDSKLETTQSQAREKTAASLLLKSYSWSQLAYLGTKMFPFVKKHRKQGRMKFICLCAVVYPETAGTIIYTMTKMIPICTMQEQNPKTP